ncbi:hypothetical protein SLE2022_211800 [Rubroshorea leprosula]
MVSSNNDSFTWKGSSNGTFSSTIAYNIVKGFTTLRNVIGDGYGELRISPRSNNLYGSYLMKDLKLLDSSMTWALSICLVALCALLQLYPITTYLEDAHL